MFSKILSFIKSGIQFVNGLDTGTKLKIIAGIGLLGGGAAIALASSDTDTDHLLEGAVTQVEALPESDITPEIETVTVTEEISE